MVVRKVEGREFPPGSCVSSLRGPEDRPDSGARFNPVQLGKPGLVPFSLCVVKEAFVCGCEDDPAGPGAGSWGALACVSRVARGSGRGWQDVPEWFW